jgi:hypothetical protein
MKTRKLLVFIGFLFWLSLKIATPVSAMDKMGMHVLHPQEFVKVGELYAESRGDTKDPLYVTIPFSLDDIARQGEWQKAFDYARQENIVPLVRITTRLDSQVGGWKKPNKREIVQLAQALNKFQWPQDKRYVIIFNEPNHAGEWGGTLDPESFAQMTDFALDWLHTDSDQYVLLPAALDLAAANTGTTAEAFGYWQQVLETSPEIANKIDAWNSHSYPNPGFMAAPSLEGKNSLRGYQHELAFLKKYTDRELPVYITETGWLDRFSQYRLSANYDYALRNIWSDERVVAVTPFVLAGSPGPFAEFSFVDEQGKPTRQWQSLALAIRRYQQHLLSQK